MVDEQREECRGVGTAPERIEQLEGGFRIGHLEDGEERLFAACPRQGPERGVAVPKRTVRHDGQRCAPCIEQGQDVGRIGAGRAILLRVPEEGQQGFPGVGPERAEGGEGTGGRSLERRPGRREQERVEISRTPHAG